MLIPSIILFLIGASGLLILGALKLSSLFPASCESGCDFDENANSRDLATGTRRDLINHTNPEPPSDELGRWLAFQGIIQ